MVDHAHRGDPLGGADPAEAVVVQRLDGFPAVLRRLADGTHVLEGADGEPLPELRPGERIRVTRPVPGDATYVRAGRVLEVTDDHADVRVDDHGQRDQQRRYVRVPAQPMRVLVRLQDGPLEGELQDLSAGGVRAVLEEQLEVGAPVRVQFELPRTGGRGLDVEVEGAVVWRDELEDGRAVMGIEFIEPHHRTEGRLANWVFQQQARRS